jgi:rubrerythrin
MKAAKLPSLNRTGIALAPRLASEMIAGTKKFPPSSKGDERGVSRMRVRYAQEAEPVGSVPPPVGVRAALKSVVKAVAGRRPTTMLDKLGERLAFERSGVRLYEALLSKHQAYGSFDGGPTLGDLKHIREDELRHFEMLRAAIQALGGDPTAVTPSANVQSTASKGIEAVLVDPRTDLLQCLEQILVAELADNECWEGLVELARLAGDERLAKKMSEALEEEQEHLRNVRKWVALGQGRSGDELTTVESSSPPQRVARRVPNRARSAGRSVATKRTGRSPRKRRKSKPRIRRAGQAKRRRRR